jgi:16S rRNA (cytosine1402-N4)-methyltransferase
MITTMNIPVHKPVLTREVLEGLDVAPGKNYIDCTLGLGGHAQAILSSAYPGGRLLGIDADPEAALIARDNLYEYSDNVTIVNDNFTNLEEICDEYDFTDVDGILFDLGISSLQLDTPERGFSFQSDAELDMRFSPEQVLTAMDLVNILPEQKLAQLLEEYGEERRARRIARAIVANRPVNSTRKLALLIEQVFKGERGHIHPATKTFLALRIVVNHELENLRSALEQSIKLLNKNGRLVVLSYHSLEDRIVKQFMKRESSGCICPPETPVCVCGHVPTLNLITKKVVTPSIEEIKNNPRSRSAKLRVAEKV